MIKTVELWICDGCVTIGVGEDAQTCLYCGEPMKLVKFVRALEPLPRVCYICGKPESSHIKYGHKYHERPTRRGKQAA